MRQIIIANWKMNLGPSAEIELAKNLKEKLKSARNEVVLCPSFLGLTGVAEVVKGSNLKLGVQDVFWQNAGAFTGEISAKFIKEIGADYVIVGHSERRQNLGETGEMINKKIAACLENGLTPIVCVGETHDEHYTGQTNTVITHQLFAALSDVELVEKDKLIIAYEPIWAISPGGPAVPKEVARAFSLISQNLKNFWPSHIVSENVRIIYGGSVDEKNVADFLAEGAGGFLVGGASLDAEKFVGIVNKF